MSELSLSRVFDVTIRKYKRNSFFVGDYESNEEVISVLADNIEEAVELGKDYAEFLNSSGSWEWYEIVDTVLTVENVFLGVEEEDTIEIEYVPEPPEGHPATWTPPVEEGL